jgi:hypothetical protein
MVIKHTNKKKRKKSRMRYKKSIKKKAKKRGGATGTSLTVEQQAEIVDLFNSEQFINYISFIPKIIKADIKISNEEKGSIDSIKQKFSPSQEGGGLERKLILTYNESILKRIKAKKTEQVIDLLDYYNNLIVEDVTEFFSPGQYVTFRINGVDQIVTFIHDDDKDSDCKDTRLCFVKLDNPELDNPELDTKIVDYIKIVRWLFEKTQKITELKSTNDNWDEILTHFGVLDNHSTNWKKLRQYVFQKGGNVETTYKNFLDNKLNELESESDYESESESESKSKLELELEKIYKQFYNFIVHDNDKLSTFMRSTRQNVLKKPSGTVYDVYIELLNDTFDFLDDDRRRNQLKLKFKQWGITHTFKDSLNITIKKEPPDEKFGIELTKFINYNYATIVKVDDGSIGYKSGLKPNMLVHNIAGKEVDYDWALKNVNEKFEEAGNDFLVKVSYPLDIKKIKRYFLLIHKIGNEHMKNKCMLKIVYKAIILTGIALSVGFAAAPAAAPAAGSGHPALLGKAVGSLAGLIATALSAGGDSSQSRAPPEDASEYDKNMKFMSTMPIQKEINNISTGFISKSLDALTSYKCIFGINKKRINVVNKMLE